MRKKLVVRQEGNKDCGACCLLSIIRYYDGNVSLNRLIDMTKTTKSGTTFYNLNKTSLELGLSSKAYKASGLDEVDHCFCPFIAQVVRNGFTHFVVVYKFFKDKVLVMDPSFGEKYMSINEFSMVWTGYMMIFEPVKVLPNYKDEKHIKKLIVSFLINNKKLVINCLFLTFVFCFLMIVNSYYLKVLVDEILNHDKYLLFVISILFLVVVIFRSLASFFRNQMLSYFNMKLDVSLFLSSFNKILLLPYYYYKNKTTGEMISRINDLSYIKQVLSKLLTTVFLDVVLLVASAFCLYFINSKMFVVSFLMGAIYFLIILIIPKIIKEKINRSQECVSSFNSYLVESIEGLETIKTLRCENRVKNKIEKLYSKAQMAIFDYSVIGNIVNFVSDLILYIGILGINYIGCLEIIKGDFSIGTLLTFNTILGYFLDPFRNFINLADEYIYVKNVLKRADGLYDVELEDLNSKNNLAVCGDLMFNNLCFSFNGKDMVLNNVNLSFGNKEKILLLGNSGSGKSTLLKILYKYYNVERGRVLVNGIDINDYKISDIRDNIIYVSQNEILYTDSVRDNILLGRDIEYKDFLLMCGILEIDKIIEKNLLGYDFVLEENGANISGGERQMIILARALFKNGDIVLIDEGLSQMDVALERRVLKNLFERFKDKMIIVVSHRFDNMDLYDRVLKLEGGVVNDYLERKGLLSG